MPMDRVTRVDVLPTALPVRSELDESRGPAQQHVFLRLETEGGQVGWGEARTLPSWTGETIEAVTVALRDYYSPVLLGSNPFARNSILAALNEIITGVGSGGLPSARSAVDMALADLQGRIADVPVHTLIGGKRRDALHLAYSLRGDSPQQMRELAQQHAAVRCFKVKLTGDPGLDAERLAAVQDGAPNATLWADANQCYSPTGAMSFLDRVRSLRRVACLQQPVASEDWHGAARVRERSHLPIAIDEGCFSADQVLRIADLRVADLIVLKLGKMGGLREVIRAADVARAAGLDLLGSGLTESGIGLAAAVHVYSTLNLRLPPQLNGPQFLECLCVDGLALGETNTVTVPNGSGLGITVDEDWIRRHAVAL